MEWNIFLSMIHQILLKYLTNSSVVTLFSSVDTWKALKEAMTICFMTLLIYRGIQNKKKLIDRKMAHKCKPRDTSLKWCTLVSSWFSLFVTSGGTPPPFDLMSSISSLLDLIWNKTIHWYFSKQKWNSLVQCDLIYHFKTNSELFLSYFHILYYWIWICNTTNYFINLKNKI